MTITRHNYEEFFLLYADHELSASDRNAVEYFITENPDLKKELDAFQQSVLSPELSLVFDHKEVLMKPVPGELPISISNYTGYFLLYADNELSETARKQVQLFADQHPSLLLELSLILQTRLEPDQTLIFKNKNILFRREKEKKIMLLPWFRIAAAALLAIVTGIFIISKKTDHRVAGNVTPATAIEKNNIQNVLPGSKKAGPAVTYHPAEPLHKNSATEEKKESDETQTKSVVQLAINKSFRDHQSKISEGRNAGESAKSNRILSKPKAPAVTGTEKITSPVQEGVVINSGNNLPDHPVVELNVPAGVSAPGSKAVEESRLAVEGVNTEPDKTFYFTADSGKKNKLRGIFRKVSRVLDRNANADDDDSKHGILVGSFQIALK